MEVGNRLFGDSKSHIFQDPIFHFHDYGRKGTLLGTNISPQNGILKMIFLFPRWDMLVPWRVLYLCFSFTHPFTPHNVPSLQGAKKPTMTAAMVPWNLRKSEKERQKERLPPGWLGYTWRIIPISTWLVTPIYRPVRAFIRETIPLRGFINHGF